MQQPHSIALLVPEIKELLRGRQYALLKDVMRECNPLDFADSWKTFGEDERLQIFKLLPASSALNLFEILQIEDQRYLLSRLNAESVAPILEGMDSPDLAKIFHRMPARFVKKMTSLIRRQEALYHIDLLMKFPEGSVGSQMHPEFVKLTPKLTARQALQRLQAIARPNQKEHLYALFITDENGRLLGSLSLQELISAPEDVKLGELMSSAERIKVKPETDQETASQIFSKYDLTAVPVVDDDSRLIGILTVQDIVSVVRQEATEDIAKMVGTRAVDLTERSVLRIVRFRMPWLIVTVFGGLLVSLIIRFFEPTLARVIALASFSPLIAGMGGNVGSQSATIMVRALALGHVNGSQRLRTVFREMRVGLVMGVVYGLLLGGFAYALYGSQYNVHFSLVVAVAMCTSMTVAATMGALGPLILERVGVDPATATGPLITTTTDILSNLTYFTLATALLLGT